MPRIVLVLAVLLVTPTLFAGFSLDDYILLYQMDGPSDREWAGSGPFDLFRWMVPGRNHRLVDGGGMPWWTYEDARLAFLRPVSSLTHAFDHALFGAKPFFEHLHSVLWFALMIALAMKVYSELIDTRWVVAVASAMFALDSAHGSAVGWISNRNAAIAGVFGIATLLFHHRRRQGAGTKAAVAGWACFALALLSGELAIGALGYLLSYALLYDQAPIASRVRSLAPHVLIAGAWAVLRASLGYGSYGLGAYVDPIHEPLEFLRVLPVRFAVLLTSQTSRIGADLYDLAPTDVRPFLRATAFLFALLIAWLCWPALQRRRAARYFAAGAVLSILPLTATIPNDRLLALAGFGVMPVLAAAFDESLRAGGSLSASLATRMRAFYTLVLVVVHLTIDPLLLPASAMTPELVGQWAASADAALPASPELKDQTLVVVTVPDSVLLSYLPVMRSFSGRQRPDKLYWLAATPQGARIERRSANVLRVHAPGGLFDQRSEARSPRLALRKGERVQFSRMTVEVIDLTADGRPSVCDFAFTEPLESRRFVWRVWEGGKVQNFALPRVGEERSISTS